MLCHWLVGGVVACTAVSRGTGQLCLPIVSLSLQVVDQSAVPYPIVLGLRLFSIWRIVSATTDTPCTCTIILGLVSLLLKHSSLYPVAAS